MVGRIESLIHCLGIDKELEGGTWLMNGSDIVNLPGSEIDVSHPSTHEASIGFNRHEARVQEPKHVANRVDGAHLTFDWTVVTEETHLMWLAKIVVDGVRIALELLLKVPSIWRASGNSLSKAAYLLTVGVLPWIGATPMFIESSLQDLHVIPHGSLGVGLHSRVDGGVDTQASGIEIKLVDGIMTRHKPFVAQVIDVVL